jgi:hypothetical protein
MPDMLLIATIAVVLVCFALVALEVVDRRKRNEFRRKTGLDL